MKRSITGCAAIVLLMACSDAPAPVETAQTTMTTDEPISYPQEVHLSNIRQLTYGGNNAEAYWSFGGDKLIFQSDNSRWGMNCDQIFLLDLSGAADSTKRQMLSTGKGRTTCSYFMPGDSTILYASTHLAMDSCPPVPEPGQGRYIWPLYPSYDIFESDMKGDIIQQLVNSPRYDAEATISPKGDKIIFTSLRSGDLELYSMNLDGSNVKQLTNTPGYDGGACFSPDGTKIVWRASRPKTEEELKTYRDLLDQDQVEPTSLEIFVADADGSNAHQVTHLGKANWAPNFTPKGDRIIFASNHTSERGFPFNLYLINLDGTGLEQLTFDSEFDAFPMFSPNGKQLAFCSNRHNGRTRDTNVFIADWKE